MIVFGVQPATPTSTLFPPPLCASSNSTADVFLFKSLTSTVLVLLVLRRGRDGVSRACIAQHGRSGSATAYEGSGAMIDVIAADPTVHLRAVRQLTIGLGPHRPIGAGAHHDES